MLVDEMRNILVVRKQIIFVSLCIHTRVDVIAVEERLF